MSQISTLPAALIGPAASDVGSGAAAARLIAGGLLAQNGDGTLGLVA